MAAVGLVALVALVVLVRPEASLAYADEHPAFVAGAAAIGAAALALAGAFAAALRQ